MAALAITVSIVCIWITQTRETLNDTIAARSDVQIIIALQKMRGKYRYIIIILLSDMYIEGTMIMRDEANSVYIPSFVNL